MNVRQVLRIKGSEVHTAEPGQTVAEAIRRLLHSKIRSIVIADGPRVVGVLTVRDILRYLDRLGGEALERPVRDVMTREVISVSPETTLVEAEQLFEQHTFNHMPVVDDGRLVGVITPADVLLRHLKDVQDTNRRLVDYIGGRYY